MVDTPELSGSIRVFLLDDHEIVLRGIADLLSSAPDIEVVGEASTDAQAFARIPACRPESRPSIGARNRSSMIIRG